MSERGSSVSIHSVFPSPVAIDERNGDFAGASPVPRWRDGRLTPPAMDLAKRCLDLVGAAMLVLAMAPLFALIALAVRLDSRGPVFYVSQRVGYRGRAFLMVKFRTMRVGADRETTRIASDRDGLCYKAAGDPRITRVGRVLRRWSLDELPQLFNVLRGEMSLVGPRPGLPSEVAGYSARARARLLSVPGLTGLWQVSGRAELTFDHMIALDLEYQMHRSLAGDFWLLCRTAGAVWTGRGAW